MRILIKGTEKVGVIQLKRNGVEIFEDFLLTIFPWDDYKEVYRPLDEEEQRKYEAEYLMNKEFFKKLFKLIEDYQKTVNEIDRNAAALRKKGINPDSIATFSDILEADKDNGSR